MNFNARRAYLTGIVGLACFGIVQLVIFYRIGTFLLHPHPTVPAGGPPFSYFQLSTTASNSTTRFSDGPLLYVVMLGSHQAGDGDGDGGESVRLTYDSVAAWIKAEGGTLPSSLALTVLSEKEGESRDKEFIGIPGAEYVYGNVSVEKALDIFIKQSKKEYLLIVEPGMVLHPMWHRRLLFAMRAMSWEKLHHLTSYMISLFNGCKYESIHCASFVCLKRELPSMGLVWNRHAAQMVQSGLGISKRAQVDRILAGAGNGTGRIHMVSLNPSMVEWLPVLHSDDDGYDRSIGRSRDFPFVDLADGIRERAVHRTFSPPYATGVCDASQISVTSFPASSFDPLRQGDEPDGSPDGMAELAELDPNLASAGHLDRDGMSLFVALLTRDRSKYVKMQSDSLKVWLQRLGGRLPAGVRFEVFDDGSNEYGAEKLKEWYPMAAKIHRLGDPNHMLFDDPVKTDPRLARGRPQRGNVITHFLVGYFLNNKVAQAYDNLLVLDSDMSVHPNWFDRIAFAMPQLRSQFLLAIYNSCVHDTLVRNNFLDVKRDVGNAGVVWSRELLEKVVNKPRPLKALDFDWRFSQRMGRTQTPIVASVLTALHLVRRGRWISYTGIYPQT
eukprot:GHVU01130581.1.p1 GENE.GHVU01130581.1~~GHVU01130581.1.p1  ORF type:complete len:612 (-),score=46.90 GHVU01130581.1:1875-3710(-)